MNNTNRGLNRSLIFLVGLVLLILGAAAVALGSLAPVQDSWKSTAPEVNRSVSGWFSAAAIPGTGVSWWSIAALVVLVVVVVALIVFIFRQGHGHTARLIDNGATADGQTYVESRVAEQLLQDALDDHPELISSHVSTYLVRGLPVLKVAATARRGVSPTAVVDTVESALESLGHLLGQPVPASVQVSGGFRARSTATTRLQ